MEDLITDAGLNSERVVSIRDLSNTFAIYRNWGLSPEEKAKITTFVEKVRQEAKTMFDHICPLTRK